MPKPLVTWWVNNQKEGINQSESVDEEKFLAQVLLRM